MAREIDAEGLEAAGDVQLVDVRTQEERDAGHIPDDTAHIPFEQLPARAGRARQGPPDRLLLPRGRPLGGRRGRFGASGFDAVSLARRNLAWQEPAARSRARSAIRAAFRPAS